MQSTDTPTSPNLASMVVAPGALADRVVLVAGASGTLGRAIALRCGALGATVALLGRSQRRLDKVYDALVAAGAPTPAVCPLDLERAPAAQYDELAQVLEAELGGLHAIVHAAGHLAGLSQLEHHDSDAIARTLMVNLHAPMLLTRACLPLLRRAVGSSLVFLTDRYGHAGRAYWGPYAASKAGLERLMESLADELEGNIRVNALYPGPIASPLRGAVWPGEAAPTASSLARVAECVAWLLAPDSDAPTGARLDVPS